MILLAFFGSGVRPSDIYSRQNLGNLEIGQNIDNKKDRLSGLYCVSVLTNGPNIFSASCLYLACACSGVLNVPRYLHLL